MFSLQPQRDVSNCQNAKNLNKVWEEQKNGKKIGITSVKEHKTESDRNIYSSLVLCNFPPMDSDDPFLRHTYRIKSSGAT